MAADPLAGLFQIIREATVIKPPVEYLPDNDDPFFRLIKANEKPTSNNVIRPTSKASISQKTNKNDALSDRTRQAISNRPLQGQARLEAVDLALKALDNPNKAQIEQILEILISG